MTEYKIEENECPTNCPKCESTDITNYKNENFALDYEDKRYFCESCEFSWSELWKFQSWEALFDE